MILYHVLGYLGLFTSYIPQRPRHLDSISVNVTILYGVPGYLGLFTPYILHRSRYLDGVSVNILMILYHVLGYLGLLFTSYILHLAIWIVFPLM